MKSSLLKWVYLLDAGMGIDETNLELMAEMATGGNRGKESTIGKLKKLDKDDVLAIYKLAF